MLVGSDIPICPAAALTGVPCPGCGLSRATFALLRGDFGQSFQLHPLGFVVAPLLFYFAVISARSYLTGKKQQTANSDPVPVLRALTGLLIAILVAVWLLRFAGALGGPVAVSRIW